MSNTNSRNILEAVAKMHGVSVDEVKSEIDFAIQQAAQNNPNIGADIPGTPEDLIAYIAQRVCRGGS